MRRFIKYSIGNIIVLLVLLLILEVVLSWTVEFPTGYFTYEPNSEMQFKVDTSYIGGIHEEISRVSFNSLGARSPEISNKQIHKIVAIGGSTTACFALNQEMTWTTLVNNKLGSDYWIGNFGRLGNDSNHHVHHVDNLLKNKDLQDAEAVLFLIGVNDFGRFLGDQSGYLHKSEYELKLSGFASMPDSELPFHRRLTLFKLLRKVKQNFNSLKNDFSYGEVQHELRLKRQAQAMVYEKVLPDLTEGLEHYRKNVERLISKVRAQGKLPIFLTQPTMWQADLSKEYERLLLMGSGFNKTNSEIPIYYATGALAAGIESFNELLIKICEEENVLYFDLANAIPKTSEAFYDDCHFNQKGAQIVADKLYGFLRENYLQNP